MDLSKINDVKELKALAYDQLALKQQAEFNLNAINQRIAEVAGQPDKVDEPIDASNQVKKPSSK